MIKKCFHPLLPFERLSILGGEGSIQVRRLKYRITTEYSSVEEEFNFRKQEDNSMPVSSFGRVSAEIVTNRDIWLPSVFDNVITKDTYRKG